MNATSAALVLLRLAGIGVAVVALIARADCAFVFGTCSVRNLLGYFTIESAILFTATLTCTLVLAVSRTDRPWWLDGVRITVASYVIVSGLVFAVLMSTAGYTGAEFLVPLSSRVLHFVLPAFAILDVMLDPPRMRRWPAWAVLVFPAAWLVVTIVRGAMTGWYPYFFVSPEAVGGYPQLAAYATCLAALLLAAYWAVRMLGSRSMAGGAFVGSRLSRDAGGDGIAWDRG
ncbi:Pr6Pr family membrane protein [Herbiconiux sp. VKM Ac-2851]|uniref:Pr6Pr family membrane protein n=1 Tax=Herbiconiux sp. VKM Ac-2851 TaxID=2739025 RepID=UPI0015650361|nr:Pr6Pr family membrane protein [Herbiconiux sp. VKM Ac-2851]NQX37198.1 Pr6Pr family membrane protein [Herbiconiux sp. VKM Ac-2851]